MAYLIGFHVEGTDVYILKCLLARLLQIDEEEVQTDVLEARSGGQGDLIATIPKALHRFYGKCARAAIIGMDNDGDVNLERTDASEAPKHPRHWNHPNTEHADCRYCQMVSRADSQLPKLNWIPSKTSGAWPVVITVSVEAIEAWLLIALDCVEPGRGARNAERLPKSILKQRFYGKPFVTKQDVLKIALPLLRKADISVLRNYSKSFDDFANQVISRADAIKSEIPCW